MKGRKPEPAALRAAEGDTRRVGTNRFQAAIAAEPRATRGLPDCPQHLSGLARETWDFWSEELAIMNLDCRPDAMMLEGLCTAYARAVAADLILARDGLVLEESVTDQSGQRMIVKI